ncbi:hypothetical protein SAMN05444395_11234 [Flavobacterium fryxellicola]|uniref:Uncharacterized protein n=1 Tax=Flavobacterium fryxellicola TaxID=249352 RepID=A0A167XB72_9FLAO|nr:hypothetical protein [Flavobacterium fryxellicola]OAB28184.1 hypothetical protein FBFR_10105 [Flavobacterium fryxellicola]SHN77979.1 hypothetical protein SAMN05444395_11234 [Flavobacterium fryxellicola]
MKNFKQTFIIILFFIGLAGHSQIAVTGFSNYVVGMNTSKNKTINFELKVFAYNYFDSLPIETNVFYNFETKEYHRFSIGLGVNLSPFRGFDEINSFVIPASLEIFPIKDFKKIALVLELTPEFRIEDNAVLRGLIGVRYSFDKK